MLLIKLDLNVFLHGLNAVKVPSDNTDDSEADETISNDASTVIVVLEHVLNEFGLIMNWRMMFYTWKTSQLRRGESPKYFVEA